MGAKSNDNFLHEVEEQFIIHGQLNPKSIMKSGPKVEQHSYSKRKAHDFALKKRR